MNKKHIIYALITAVFFSSTSYANDRHERHESHHSKHQSKHSYNNHYNNRHNDHHEYRNHRRNYNSNKHYSNGNAPFSTYGYNQPYRNNYNYRNRNRNKNYRQYKRHQNYNNNYRRYNNYNNYNNYNSYNNYQPYYQSQYTYRPLRGLGHYYTDDYYGYGHWHDNSWCSIQHSQDYYYDYYSNYPYQNGWTFGDGDFGINFYIN